MTTGSPVATPFSTKFCAREHKHRGGKDRVRAFMECWWESQHNRHGTRHTHTHTHHTLRKDLQNAVFRSPWNKSNSARNSSEATTLLTSLPARWIITFITLSMFGRVASGTRPPAAQVTHNKASSQFEVEGDVGGGHGRNLMVLRA